jgi:hypothetical protein
LWIVLISVAAKAIFSRLSKLQAGPDDLVLKPRDSADVAGNPAKGPPVDNLMRFMGGRMVQDWRENGAKAPAHAWRSPQAVICN